MIPKLGVNSLNDLANIAYSIMMPLPLFLFLPEKTNILSFFWSHFASQCLQAKEWHCWFCSQPLRQLWLFSIKKLFYFFDPRRSSRLCCLVFLRRVRLFRNRFRNFPIPEHCGWPGKRQIIYSGTLLEWYPGLFRSGIPVRSWIRSIPENIQISFRCVCLSA